MQWYRGRRYFSLFYRLYRAEKLRKLDKLAKIVGIFSALAGIIIGLFYDRIAGTIFIINSFVAPSAVVAAVSKSRYRRKTGACFLLSGLILLGLIIFGFIIEPLRYIIELLIPELKLNIYNVLRSIALSVLAITLIIFGLFLLDP
ncbi:MAG: hypothetical protein QXH44_10130 [Pyrobaculum sp.]